MSELTPIIQLLDHIELKEEMVDGRRFYTTPEGNKYPSITTILSWHFREELAEMRKYMEEAGLDIEYLGTRGRDRGSKMHELIENHYLYGRIDHVVVQTEFDEIGLRLYKTMRQHLKKIDPVAIEIPLWSDTIRIAGRCDTIGVVRDLLSIVDYKTSSRPKTRVEIASYWLQTAFYAIAFEELYQLPIEQTHILIAQEKGLPQAYFEANAGTLNGYREQVKLIAKQYHAEVLNTPY